MANSNERGAVLLDFLFTTIKRAVAKTKWQKKITFSEKKPLPVTVSKRAQSKANVRETKRLEDKNYRSLNKMKPMRYAHSDGHTDLCYDDSGRFVLRVYVPVHILIAFAEVLLEFNKAVSSATVDTLTLTASCLPDSLGDVMFINGRRAINMQKVIVDPSLNFYSVLNWEEVCFLLLQY